MLCYVHAMSENTKTKQVMLKDDDTFPNNPILPLVL
jgi:hypothetical protein